MKFSNFTQRRGFTLVEIMIVVAIIGLLAAIAIPNFVKARSSSQQNSCVANLTQISGAKATWCLEKQQGLADTPLDADLFGATGYIKKKPLCPGSGTYTLSQVDTDPTCSLAAAPDNHFLP